MKLDKFIERAELIWKDRDIALKARIINVLKFQTTDSEHMELIQKEAINDLSATYGVLRCLKIPSYSNLFEFFRKQSPLPSYSSSEQTTKLADELISKLGTKRNISAASKILWVMYGEPFCIYDDNAVSSLYSLSKQGNNKVKRKDLEEDYKTFCDTWYEEYEKWLEQHGIVKPTIIHRRAFDLYLHGLV